MGRTILAVLAGLLVMVFLVGLIESVGHNLYPVTVNLSLNSGEDAGRIMEAMPLGAKVFVIAAWAIGAFGGALVAALVSKLHKRGAALVIAIAMLAAAGYSLVLIPHPWWMAALGLLLPVPLALTAWWLVRGKPQAAAG